MKKKGFTLIELLAVIIILAVIALIATPIVLNVVDNARVEANRDSVYGLLDGAKLYYLEGQLDTNRLGMDGETNLIDKINVTGKRPSGGNIYIDDTGLIALSVVYDKVCYKKGFNENEITETNKLEECETKINDKTTPEITTVVTSKTDRIKVNLSCNDFESGIIKYEYKIDDNEWIESNNEYIFENLEKEREYEIRTRCTNGVNLVSEESKKISTKGIINPEIAQISQEPSSGTYAVKRIIRITYDNTNIENAKNYYSYDGKTWVEVNDTKIDLEFTDNSLLYAKTTDGINTSTYATYTIANIDTTVPDIKIDISNVKTDRVTLTLTCSAKSGITKYEYSKDDGSTWVEGSNSYTFTGLTQGTSYQYKGRCTNGSGLSNTISSEDSTYTIANPKIAQISQEPSSGTYAVKRIIRITYDNTNIENAKNYYSYDGKTWVEVNDTKIDLEFTSNSLLYAKTTDGINTSTYATYSVVNIDTIKPTLTLSKITYEEGFNNWNDSRISNGILTLSESGTVWSNYYNVNKEPWYITFDVFTTASTTSSGNFSNMGSAGRGSGGVNVGTQYYDSSYNVIASSNGYTGNGLAGQLPLNTWSDGFSWNGWEGYGTQYLKIQFLTGNECSQPTVKIRNFRLYGQLYNTFYLINVNPNDNIGIDVTKYAKGNVDISYFKSNGSIATSNEIRVTENGIYTVYVKDLAGNEVISTIEIDKILYKDSVLNGADPELKDNLVPVVINNDGTVKKADLSKEWYNYTNKTWANAVLLNGNDTYSVGDTIVESAIKAYYVWIPRYKYQIFYDGKNATSKQLINIEFENKNTTKSNSTTKGEWLTHPAFTFGEEELNGIWVGKFELTGDTDNPTIKPNVTNLTNQKVSTLFTTTQKLSTNSSMLKNIEWGSITYLTTSIYGQGLAEVRINNSKTTITGCASSIENGSAYSGCENAYNTAIGYLASTTGNISGIYDMSGGAGEYMFDVMEDSLDSNIPPSSNDAQANSGFTGKNRNDNSTPGVAFPESKYYNIYKYGTSYTDYTRYHLGDATTETKEWNGDYSYFVYPGGPWFHRGGGYGSDSGAGIFAFDAYNGDAYSYSSTRVVLR